MNKVFLGGTCAETTWRDELIKAINIKYFNPIVENWTSDCVITENIEKEFQCNIHLYVLTSEMQGVYSIAEAVQSSLSKNKFTILHVIPSGFSEGQLRSLEAVCSLISGNGSIAYIDSDLYRTSTLINNAFSASS
jgi:predicted TIM-barrel enzyme